MHLARSQQSFLPNKRKLQIQTPDNRNYREELARIMVNHHKEYENGSMPIAVRSLDQVIKQL